VHQRKRLNLSWAAALQWYKLARVNRELFVNRRLRDLLFADGEVALGTSAWIAMLHIHGFDFVCEEVNGDLVRAARAAGFPGAPLWSVRDSRRFQREQPFAFGGTQFLWFERRARLRR